MRCPVVAVVGAACIVAAALGGCIRDDLLRCGDQVCPIGSRCIDNADGQRCVGNVFFDAPIDAPPICPALGGTPSAASTWQQLPIRNCRDLTLSSDESFGVASCGLALSEALPSGLLGMIPTSSPDGTSFYPRLAPEGDELFYVAMIASEYELRRTRRDTSGQWSAPETMQRQFQIYISSFGVPSAGLLRRMLMIDFNAAQQQLVEVELDGTLQIRELARYPISTLTSLPNVPAPNLSPDGLRMTFSASDDGVWYADRDSLTARFTNARQIANSPNVADAFVTSQCGRMYFSAAGAMFQVRLF